MYIRRVLINILKVRNVIFCIAGAFSVVASAEVIVSLLLYYRDDIDTALNAVAMPDAVTWLIGGVILLVIRGVSKRFIGDANLYSNYFEGDLDGFIEYEDLAKVTGEKIFWIKIKLAIFKALYMKGYRLRGRIVLNSKTCLCECRSCGGQIEKSMYFTGKCSYCGSSDLYAKVLAGNKFYSIERDKSDASHTPEFYQSPRLKSKLNISVVNMIIGGSVTFLALCMVISETVHYNDKEYLTEVLMSGESYSSFKLIKAEILKTIVAGVALLVGFWQVLYSGMTRFGMYIATKSCSKYFAKRKTPFVKITSLPPVKKWISKRMGLNAVRGALRRGYLTNCSFEKHKGELMLVLAKKIVKDQCPSCGAPITNAVDEHYKCKYCDRTIMYTIRKK